jgi:hypothetical protein
MPALAPLTWASAVLGVFFAVGGRTSVGSWRRAQARGESYGRWLARRIARLAGPLPVAAAVALPLIGVAALVGLDPRTARAFLLISVQPLWFLAVYAALTAAAGLAVRLDQRWGNWSLLGMAAAIALFDLSRRGVLPGVGWLTWLAALPGWGFAFQIGVAWERGGWSRRAGRRLALGGLLGAAGLIGLAGYSPAMILGPGSLGQSNTHPPSLMALALASAAVGAVIWGEPLWRQLVARNPPGRIAAAFARDPIGVLIWHQPAALLPALVLTAAFPGLALPGLTTAPVDPAWVIWRLAWLPLFAVLLAAVLAVRSGTSPSDAARRGGRRS